MYDNDHRINCSYFMAYLTFFKRRLGGEGESLTQDQPGEAPAPARMSPAPGPRGLEALCLRQGGVPLKLPPPSKPCLSSERCPAQPPILNLTPSQNPKVLERQQQEEEIGEGKSEIQGKDLVMFRSDVNVK